jgi:hypothetical protein
MRSRSLNTQNFSFSYVFYAFYVHACYRNFSFKPPKDFFFGADRPYMKIEKIDLSRIVEKNKIEVLRKMQVGESLFSSDPKEAESIRVTSYYMVKSRGLPWKFISRKMDRGWRLIRVA